MRSTCSIPRGTSSTGIRARNASRAMPARKSSANTSPASTPRRTGGTDSPDQFVGQAIATGKYEGEGWRVRKDGSRFWASVVIHAIRDADGQLVGFAKVTRDLTERREAEEQLRQVAEDGGDRPAHRRDRTRLQQSADRDLRQSGNAAASPRGSGGRTPAAIDLVGLAGSLACGAAHASAPGVFAPPDARAEIGVGQHPDRPHVGAAAPHASRSDLDRDRARRRRVEHLCRCEPARELSAEPRGQRARCHARWRAADDRSGQRLSR